MAIKVETIYYEPQNKEEGFGEAQRKTISIINQILGKHKENQQNDDRQK